MATKAELRKKAKVIVKDDDLTNVVLKELKLVSMPHAADIIGVARQHLYEMLKTTYADAWVIDIDTGENRALKVMPMKEAKRIAKARNK